MQIESIPRELLIKQCKTAMSTYGMSENCIETYLLCFYRLYEYMQKNAISDYTEDIGELYCEYLQHEDLSSSYKKRHFRAVNLLRLIMKNRPYSTKPNYNHPVYSFAGEIGAAAQKYLNRQENLRISPVTLNQKKRILGAFSVAMTNHGKTLSNLRSEDVIEYISCIQASRGVTISILKGFFSYLNDIGILSINIAKDIINIKQIQREKIISYYTQKEVSIIEKSINRTTTSGKRNYAMILLASRLGLRASDIIRLTFDNIDWEKNLITFKQFKTKRLITLPLLADVGSAIIDYILYARPKTIGLNNVFICINKPYRPCTTTSISSTVQSIIKKSGVSFAGRHTGAHCLRHSLATSLLNEGTDFPVISEVLGHESSSSTMRYLGVNVKELLACSLDVPEIPESFYIQKGGWFYD